MSESREIRYEALIDRLANDLQPVRRLWSVRRRLGLWVALEAAIVLAIATLMGPGALAASIASRGAAASLIFLWVSIAAARLALKGAVPDRTASLSELIVLGLGLAIGGLTMTLGASDHAIGVSGWLRDGALSAAQLVAWAGLPGIALFVAIRRGVALSPGRTGALAGIAALCFGVAIDRFVAQWSGAPCPSGWLLILAATVTPVSAWAGYVWLDPSENWQSDDTATTISRSQRAWFDLPKLYPAALAAAAVILIFALRGTRANFAAAPDFDLAINRYEQSLTSFQPNVPSGSIDIVLTAYIEHGMPSYMWDFGPKGFKLVGGRLEDLPDGTPASFTWFRKDRTGVMCLFRAASGFNPPRARHDTRDGMLFYRYRGFSVCLINLGNYGNFISVIVAPMPLDQFEQMVLDAAR
jgi:hypothetical protein